MNVSTALCDIRQLFQFWVITESAEEVSAPSCKSLMNKLNSSEQNGTQYWRGYRGQQNFFKQTQYIKGLFFSGAVPGIVCVIQLKVGFLWLRTSCTCSVVHDHPRPALWQTKECLCLCCQKKSADLLDQSVTDTQIHFWKGLPGAVLPLRKERFKTSQTHRLSLQKKSTLHTPFPYCLSSQLPRCKVSAKLKCALLVVPSLFAILQTGRDIKCDNENPNIAEELSLPPQCQRSACKPSSTWVFNLLCMETGIYLHVL